MDISKIYIEVSDDDVTWTKIDSVVGFLAATFTSYSKVVNSATAQYVRISPSGEDRLILDEFSITDTAVACSGYFIDSVATEICAFDSVEFRGTFYKTDGIHKDTVTSTCDTIFILNLSTTIYTSYDVFDTICSVSVHAAVYDRLPAQRTRPTPNRPAPCNSWISTFSRARS